MGMDPVTIGLIMTAVAGVGTAVNADQTRKAAHGQLDQSRKQAADEATAQALNEDSARKDAALAEQAQTAAEAQDTSATEVETASTANTTAATNARKAKFSAATNAGGLSL